MYSILSKHQTVMKAKINYFSDLQGISNYSI